MSTGRTVAGTVGRDTYEELERYCEERGINKAMAVRRGLRRLLTEEEPNAVPR